MNISVHLHTILQRQTPEGPVGRVDACLPEGSTIADLLRHLEVSLEPDALLLVVNGRMAELEQTLQEGDQVNLMPAISGGAPGAGALADVRPPRAGRRCRCPLSDRAGRAD